MIGEEAFLIATPFIIMAMLAGYVLWLGRRNRRRRVAILSSHEPEAAATARAADIEGAVKRLLDEANALGRPSEDLVSAPISIAVTGTDLEGALRGTSFTVKQLSPGGYVIVKLLVDGPSRRESTSDEISEPLEAALQRVAGTKSDTEKTPS